MTMLGCSNEVVTTASAFGMVGSENYLYRRSEETHMCYLNCQSIHSALRLTRRVRKEPMDQGWTIIEEIISQGKKDLKYTQKYWSKMYFIVMNDKSKIKIPYEIQCISNGEEAMLHIKESVFIIKIPK